MGSRRRASPRPGAWPMGTSSPAGRDAPERPRHDAEGYSPGNREDSMRWIAVVALVAGCDGASPSSQLDQTSGDSAGIVWVDADGDEVPGIVQLDQLAYVDDAGDIWTLDPWGE